MVIILNSIPILILINTLICLYIFFNYLCITLKQIIIMKEIVSELTDVMPQKEGGKMEMPTFFEKPTLWFFIKMKIKNIFNKIIKYDIIWFNKNN